MLEFFIVYMATAMMCSGTHGFKWWFPNENRKTTMKFKTLN